MRTAYGLTPTRAIVAVGDRRVRESPVRQVPVSIPRSRDGRHVSITFGASGGWRVGGYYANTGMDFLNMTDGLIGFFDASNRKGRLPRLIELVRNRSSNAPVCASGRAVLERLPHDPRPMRKCRFASVRSGRCPGSNAGTRELPGGTRATNGSVGRWRRTRVTSGTVSKGSRRC